MAIVINGSGTISGLSVGGLPNGTVDNDTIASGVASSKLTGALPAISGASLTSLPSQKINPNLIINGAMQVSQRSSGTVAQANSSNEGYATLDRFALQYGNNAGGTITTSQSTTSPDGFGTSYKLDVTSADTSISGNEIVYAQQVIESQNMANSGWDYTNSSSKITLSFWVRNSKTGTYCVAFDNYDGSKMYTAEYTVSTADTWEKKTVTIPGNSNLVFNFDEGAGLGVYFMLANASGRYGSADSWVSPPAFGTSNQVNFLDSTSNVMYLTGVKLEVGDTATDFQHRTYGDELTLCRRYFQAHTITQHVPLCVDWEGGSNSGNMRGSFQFDVPMRASPTQGFLGSCTWYNQSNNSGAPATMIFTPNLFIAYNDEGLNILGDSSDDAITFSAEL